MLSLRQLRTGPRRRRPPEAGSCREAQRLAAKEAAQKLAAAEQKLADASASKE